MTQQTLLNPEAGAIRQATDPREIDALLAAGRLTLGEMPYVVARFGERGERFTRSDSSWLVTLSDLAPEATLQQVKWLGGVLASRGMPRYMLERHLGHLVEALVVAVPEREGPYRQLEAARDVLRRDRLACLDEAATRALIAEFAPGPDAWAAKLPDTATWIVAAVTDEALGTVRAVPSLLEWLADPERFSPTWIAAVNALVERARAARRSP